MSIFYQCVYKGDTDEIDVGVFRLLYDKQASTLYCIHDHDM